MSRPTRPLIPKTLRSLRASLDYSREKLEEVERGLREAVPGPHDELCVFAVGSYGRSEAHEGVSDFEWITVYDDERVGNAEAWRSRPG